MNAYCHFFSFLSNSKWFQQGAFLFLITFSKSNFIVALDRVCNMYYFLDSDLFLLYDNHIPKVPNAGLGLIDILCYIILAYLRIYRKYLTL